MINRNVASVFIALLVALTALTGCSGTLITDDAPVVGDIANITISPENDTPIMSWYLAVDSEAFQQFTQTTTLEGLEQLKADGKIFAVPNLVGVKILDIQTVGKLKAAQVQVNNPNVPAYNKIGWVLLECLK